MMKKIKLKIKGMHCKSCEMLIEDALEDLGINKCKIDSLRGGAEIDFDEKKISVDKIKKVIKNEGYEVE